MRSQHKPKNRVTVNLTDLISEGRVQTAVDLLERQGYPEPLKAVGKTQLLQRAQRFLATSAVGAEEWPPRAGARLAPVGEIPEVAAADLDIEALTNGVLGSGSLIVRGLVSAEQASDLRSNIDRVMAAREALHEGRANPTDVAWFERFDPEMKSFAGPAAVYVSDSPRMALEISSLYRDLGIVDLIEGYLSEKPALSLRKWVLRRVPAGANTGWHQDGNFLGLNTRNMNLWIGLSDNGVTAPGLDLVPLRFNDLVESGTGDADFDWSVGNAKVDHLLGDHEVVRPDLKAGDAVFFDHMCLHRTGVTQTMTDTRYAIESWFFAPSHFPDDYKGFLL